MKSNDALIIALASGKTIVEAASASGVADRTVYRRLQDAAFRKLVSDARGEMMGQALGKLADAACRAVQTLEELLAAEAESVRLGSARTILETGSRLRLAIEMESRLLALEERVMKDAGVKS